MHLLHMQSTQNTNKAKLNLAIFKYFSWLNVILAIVMIGAGFAYVLKPKYRMISGETEIKLAEYRDRLEARDKYLNNLIDLDRTYQEISPEDREKINGILPGSADAGELMRQLELIVKSNGGSLSLLNIVYNRPKPKTPRAAQYNNKKNAEDPFLERKLPEGAEKFQVELTIEGLNYQSMKKLLASFENSVRLMDVEEVSFESAGAKMTVMLSAYYLK
jgi:hypothetical protein